MAKYNQGSELLTRVGYKRLLILISKQSFNNVIVVNVFSVFAQITFYQNMLSGFVSLKAFAVFYTLDIYNLFIFGGHYFFF